jgi:hypothetical protein
MITKMVVELLQSYGIPWTVLCGPAWVGMILVSKHGERKGERSLKAFQETLNRYYASIRPSDGSAHAR